MIRPIWGIYTSRIHWVVRGNGTPKDRDEVHRREVCEYDGWVCDLEVIGAPSRLRLIRKAAALARIDEKRDLIIEEKAARRKWKNAPIFDCADWTPEAAKKRSVSRWVCKNKILINSLWRFPDVLAIPGIKEIYEWGSGWWVLFIMNRWSESN